MIQSKPINRNAKLRIYREKKNCKDGKIIFYSRFMDG